MPDAPTDRPVVRLPRRLALPAAAALLLAGCGLADYEARMSSEAAFVQHWDEEVKMLGDPINAPELPKADDKDVIWNVFLCLPRGVNTTPVSQPNSTLSQLYGGLLAQYPGGKNAYGIQNVYLGVGVDQKDYPATILSVFGVGAGGETSVNVPRSPVLKANSKGLGPEVALKQKLVESPTSAYSFNFFEQGNTQVAVIFQTEKGALDRSRNALRMSLGTLAEGSPNADVSRNAYNRTHRKALKK